LNINNNAGYVKNVRIGKNQGKLNIIAKMLPIIKESQKLIHIQHERSFPKNWLLI